MVIDNTDGSYLTSLYKGIDLAIQFGKDNSLGNFALLPFLTSPECTVPVYMNTSKETSSQVLKGRT